MTPRLRSRLPVAFALLALVILAGPAAVLAHAELDTVAPADKSTVEGSPAEIVMTFVQDLDPTKSSIRVVNSAGAIVIQGGTVAPGKPREMTLELTTPLPPDAYQIRWISWSSEDNERDSGTTTFTVVAAPSPSPSPTPAPSTAAPSSTPSIAPSIAPTVAPSPSSPTTAPASSTSDALIPILAVVVVIGALGLWLLRGRSRIRG